MYHSVIGEKLISAFNRQNKKEYTAKDFFDEIYFPLFFGNPNYLQNVNNSPVDQAYKQKKNKPLTPERLEECRQQIHQKIANDTPDASFFMGSAAAGSTGSTSGQVTGIAMKASAEEIYCSWIGAALGVTVDGGLSLLIDSDEVLLILYDGWERYRQYLSDTSCVKPMQVNTWNGQWLAFRLGSEWFEECIYQPVLDSENKMIVTQSWPKLLFSLANKFSKESLGAYVYSFGQTNRTVGFIRVELPRVRSLADIYRQNFETPEGLSSTSFEDLYETERSFVAGCQQTFIGLKALKPKDVFHVERGELPKLAGNDPKKTLSANTYKTWIIAMLNNKDLLARARELSGALHIFATAEGQRLKTDRSALVEEKLLKASRRQGVIDALTGILEKDATQVALFRKAVEDVISLPAENVPLFLSLLRFEYAAAKASAKEKK